MSNQKPNSCYEFEHTIHSLKKTMVIQQDGVCDACHACHDKEGKIDWADRERQLRELCDRYRRTDGGYDCLVPGSGGKDSFYAAHLLKYKYGMHPLTVTWAPHIYTPVSYTHLDVYKRQVFAHLDCGAEEKLLTRLSQAYQKLDQEEEWMEADLATAEKLEDALESARFYHDAVLKRMDTVRAVADAVEADLPDGALPYPNYEKLLFSV